LVTHAMTCNEAEGLDWRPSDIRGRSDDHRPSIDREHGGQKIDDTICERNQSAGGIFHRVHAVQRPRSPAAANQSTYKPKTLFGGPVNRLVGHQICQQN